MDSYSHSLLIVDDDRQVLDMLLRILEQRGYRCRTAENVAQAKQALAEETFDLLLTDRYMPGGSGVDLIRYIQTHYAQTAAIMVTGVDDPELAKEVLDLGVYGFIVKPFARNLVLITVENALRRHRLELQEQRRTLQLEQEVVARTISLDEQVRFLQTLIDAIPIPVYYKDVNCVYLGCNQAFANMFKLPPEAIIGKQLTELLDPVLAGEYHQKDQELFQDGGVQVFEKEVVYADGSRGYGVYHKAAFRDREGAIAGLVGARFDITELKNAEQSLRISEESLRSIMDNLNIGVVMISPSLEILRSNRQMGKWFPGVGAKTGKHCYQVLINPQQQAPCEACPAQKVFELGELQEIMATMRTAQGERIFRVATSPIFDDADTITAAVELFEDVTDRLAAEREFRQAQKLEAIGQLAAGIAHEINTPVQYVGDNIRFLDDAFRDLVALNEKYTDLLKAVQTAGPVAAVIQALEEVIDQADVPFLLVEIPKTIQQSMDGISRIGEIVRAMKDFSHPGSEEKVHVDINRILASTLTVCRNEWKYVADVETDLAPGLPLVPCLAGEINQVFLNLIVNAAHAITDITENGTLGKGLIRLSTCIHDGWLEIRVADTGGGIPEAVQDRIFDPFFTTKKIGKGTGQGLAIARSVVVDKHQGTLCFETEVNKGTTFIVQLPLR